MGYFLVSSRSKTFFTTYLKKAPSLGKVFNFYGIFLLVLGILLLVFTLLGFLTWAVLTTVIAGFFAATLPFIFVTYM